jgi:hypothetical protein
LAGVTAIEASTGGPTVSVLLPLMPFRVALISEVPCDLLVATPVDEMVATDVFDEIHDAVPLTSPVEPSLYVPVATNGWVFPSATVGSSGVTRIETSAGGCTVNAVLPLTLPEVALICEVPWAAPEARPEEEIDATEVFDEAQFTALVRSAVD